MPRRPRRRRQARGLDVARRRGEAAQGLRAAARRPRGHARSRRDRRAARRARARHAAAAVPAGDGQGVPGHASCSASPTDTLDASGEVARPAADADRRATRSSAACRRFLGDIEQVPPMVSAVKVGGRRLHELARARRGGRARAAPRAHRPDRRRASSSPARTRPPPFVVECGSGTYVRSLAADLGAALGGCAHLGRAAPRCASARSRSTRRTPLDDDRGRSRAAAVLSPAAAMRDLEPVGVDAEQARAVAHGVTFAAAACARRERRCTGPFAVVGARRRAARGLRAARRGACKPAVVAGRGDLTRATSTIVRDLAELAAAARRPGAVVTIGAYDGVHLGHQAVLRLVRELADARGLDGGVRHLRPPPRRGRAARVGAEAPHDARAEARAARRDRLPRRVLSCSRSTRRAARSRRRTSCARCSSSGLGARLVVVGADFHFGHRRGGNVPLLERMGAELGFEVLGLGLVRRRGRRRAGTLVLVDRDPRAARRGRRRRGGAPHARPAARGARDRSSDGDQRGRELGFPTANVAVPERICLPADGDLRRHVRRRRRRRAPGRDLARPPPDLLRATPSMSLLEATCSTSTATSTASARRCASVERLRGEERFDSVDALVAQMHARRRGDPPPAWLPEAPLVGPRAGVGACWSPFPDIPDTDTKASVAHARQDRHDRRAPPPRDRHRVARGADRAAHRAHQPPHRAPEGPQEGPSTAGEAC